MSESTPSPSAAAQALLPWHRDLATAMLQQRSRWPQALLIAGRRGLGKRALALHFARALLCEAPRPDGDACGVCPSCLYVAAGAHPDLRLIEPLLVDDEGNVTIVDVITVDRVREFIDFTRLSMHRHRAKIVVIAPAEAMNEAAANALLKTLEEPPDDTYLMLVSHQPERLRPTIVSRCRRLPVAAPDAGVAAAWLAAQGVADADRVLAQAGGAPLLALELADPALQREGEALLAELERPERLSPVAVGSRLAARPKDEWKARLAAVVYWLMTWTADLASVASGGPPRFHPQRRAALAELATRVARVPLFRYYQLLLQQRALLSHPLAPRLVAEALLIDYRDLFVRGRGG